MAPQAFVQDAKSATGHTADERDVRARGVLLLQRHCKEAVAARLETAAWCWAAGETPQYRRKVRSLAEVLRGAGAASLLEREAAEGAAAVVEVPVWTSLPSKRKMYQREDDFVPDADLQCPSCLEYGAQAWRKRCGAEQFRCEKCGHNWCSDAGWRDM
eukprot:gnl/TRDRNA2_/TRDRNA2_116647_c0_seq2.p3 gnl/TRDRNA2_/TRDRNA2_116647_c0~~gnl/TRDRNA2_/TRDRNA2_116647_c0_seq2.p3  ORF type:complete len:158 (+),score=30.37 gnl/TRDRNA2_/TRDRNA2_116647_c0_seq2:164-637(+)